MKITITGASGFIGFNLYQYLKNNFQLNLWSVRYSKDSIFHFEEENVVIHLAGIAHDLKNHIRPDEYYKANYELTKKLYDAFLISKVNTFIFLSTTKAVADRLDCVLDESHTPNPKTHYGKSKLLAEKYILSQSIPSNKKVYILRPCMIHGKGNKGNLNLLYRLIVKRIPWPLGSFTNKRSYCSIENLLFIIQELITNSEIPSGIYNIADDNALSTTEVITLIGRTTNINTRIYSIPRMLIKIVAKIGDLIHLPLNSERLQKLTESYVVDNSKIKKALKKPLPVTSEDGLIQTIKSFYDN
jgi:nucleoside-diphosphate-sugar epimerase